MEKIKTSKTSLHTAVTEEPILLSETKTTRRIFEPTLNDTKVLSGETVSGTIIHQRKSKNGSWEDSDFTNLNTLKVGQEVKLRLDSKQTKKLYDGLTKLYGISKDGLKPGITQFTIASADEVIRVDKDRKVIIERLLEKDYGEDVWKELIRSNPDLATRLSIARINEDRLESLKEFKKSLSLNKSEDYWQDFFKRNQWIFGYGLKYQFLSTITDQPHYGGTNIEGRGNQKGDFLTNTEAQVKFTVLVEIKKPETKIFSYKKSQPVKYRNGAYLLSGEIMGGTSQIQANIRKWSFHSKLPDKKLDGVHTIEPDGILIIGHMKEFEKNKEMIETFEGYRSNLNKPTILTFDELYERAKYIAHHSTIDESNEEDLPVENDLPF